ncbi:hypothetical protein HG531_008763 [Fusarium graminearum]|nr:hypothetical protein HG531_008763 [Fusarium graminearum]
MKRTVHNPYILRYDSNEPAALASMPRWDFCRSTSLVVRLAVENAQDGKEEVDDVEVKADGSGNLLLNVVVAQDKLGVDEDVTAEDESGKTTIDKLTSGAVREEHGHETKDDETPEGTEKIRHP